MRRASRSMSPTRAAIVVGGKEGGALPLSHVKHTARLRRAGERRRDPRLQRDRDPACADLHGPLGDGALRLPGGGILRQVRAVPRRRQAHRRDAAKASSAALGSKDDLALLDEFSRYIPDGSLCGFGVNAVHPVVTAMKYFGDDFSAHLEGRCPTGVCSPVRAHRYTTKHVLVRRHETRDTMAVTIREEIGAATRDQRFERNEHGQRSFDITIDGRTMRAYEGQTVLSVAIDNGILDIPNLCNDEKLEPTSACRMCLVEIDGAERPLPSCNTPATPGMVVRTKSDRLHAHPPHESGDDALRPQRLLPAAVPGRLPDAHRHPRLSGVDRQGAEPRGGAAGQRGAAVPLHPRPDLSRRPARRSAAARWWKKRSPSAACTAMRPSSASTIRRRPGRRRPPTGKKVAIVGAGPCRSDRRLLPGAQGPLLQGLRHAAPGRRHAALRHPGVSPAQGHDGSGVRGRLEAGRRRAVQRQARRGLHD